MSIATSYGGFGSCPFMAIVPEKTILPPFCNPSAAETFSSNVRGLMRAESISF